jgi:SpoVK/Ycf46/Vps4 family AAA+-type ATPase
MTPYRSPNWLNANQRYLMAALGLVRARLERLTARTEDGAASERSIAAAEVALDAEGQGLPAPAALETLCAAFGLSEFERDLLLLCAGSELDSSFAGLYAAAQGDVRRGYPTFSLALAVLPHAHWSALSPAGPLRRWRMIEVGAGESLTASPLRIDERILHYLCGVNYLDERLRGVATWIPVDHTGEAHVSASAGNSQPGAGQSLPPSQAALAAQISQLWTRPRPDGDGWPVVQLHGEAGAGKRAIVAWACAELGLQLHTIQAANLPPTAVERETLARLWEREAALGGSALVLDCDDVDTVEAKRTVAAFVSEVQAMLVLTGREPLPIAERQTLRLRVPRLTVAEQRVLWQQTLGASAGELNGQLDAVAMQFNLDVPGIQAIGLELLGRLAAEPATGTQPNQPPDRVLWEACRAHARPRLEDMAQGIEPAATWDDLVLTDTPRQILRDVAAHVRQRVRVYSDWGFEHKSTRGLGISALFAGASGTGKTMAAEVLANELQLDLFRIDLSQVVSKYIGETEKNLRRVFDAAEEGGVILLFDEADALFGKRSEVKDSHDRYANIEVSYLLQRMESYRGLAILTTNMKQALDPAFLRRIRFVVQFPFPDAVQRAQIWRRIFPPQTPIEGLDVVKLARLNVAGGNIRNIALNAAFLAADAGQPVGMVHLLAAARSEYAKMEKPLTEAEIGAWV